MKRSIALVCGLLACSLAKAVVVNMSVFSFGFGEVPGISSDPLIEVGDTVHWVWNGPFHSVTSAAGQPEVFNSGIKNSGTFDYVFNLSGSTAYFCTVHGFDLGGGNVSGMSGHSYTGSATNMGTLALARGRVKSGTVSACNVSDNQYLVLQMGPVLGIEAPIQAVFDSAPVLGTPSRMSIRVEDAVSSTGLRRRIEAWNVQTQSYEQVDQVNAPLTDTFASIKLAGTVSRFIDSSSKRVRIRVSYFVGGAGATGKFTARLDRLVVVSL